MEKIILGIDPGTHRLGVGVIKKSGSSVKLISAETLQAPSKASLYDRLSDLYEKLDLLLEKFHPHEVAIEDIFVSENPRSAFQIGIARGVVFALCIKHGIKLFEYAPSQVKQTVTGHGRADKEQVRKMAGILVGSSLEMGLDASDAVAIAVCHASQTRLKSLLSC
jgi:crossover junction endodeoxyribonuclease RuvC